MERRVRALEAVFDPHTRDIQALAERMAEDDGGWYTAAELISEARAMMDAIGPPYTAERMNAHIAETFGISVAELEALEAEYLERYT